ncbi:synaptic vesicle glycoprotein 2C-like [Saccoglossus kowalevskii]|uniref:Synaptic vesicle glycoprotein 2C-like n=1 Tax=Saccoglossus kowalevskii TaxID=10224 RepID=A0ABM0GTZ9_SACKO|nr:PREDICTED: synaptic vesicle glycoprotein 2C-like [Saccoglossus kowalevskii]
MAEPGSNEELQLIGNIDYAEKNYCRDEADSELRSPGSTTKEDAGIVMGSPEKQSNQVFSGNLELAEAYEQAIAEVGFGKYQIALYFAIGFGLMADGAEIFIVGFIIPSAERDLCLNDSQKGWLGGIVFVGMLIGALIWGMLSDKLGRRKCLITALSINALFAIISAFVRKYGFFLFCRLACGIGIGGSIPITFAYYCEFVAKPSRGANVTWLLFMWTMGGVYVSLLGWGIIPRTEISFFIPPDFEVHSWRVFVLLGSLPCLVAIVMLFRMEESPRFLLEVITRSTFTVLSGVGAFFIWWVDTEVSAVALSCVIQFMSLANWSAIDVASTLLYPTSKRATAFGLLSAFSRIGGVLGNVSFGNFLHVSRAIPVLLSAAVFGIGGILSLKLPDTRKSLLV